MQVEVKSGAYYITWPVCPIKIAAFNYLRSSFIKSHDYAPMVGARLGRLRKMVSELRQSYPINMQAAKSIHHIVVKQKIIQSYNRINAIIGRIAPQYNAGAGIMDLSLKYDFPPLMLLRSILLYNGESNADMYKLFINHCDPADILIGRDYDEYIIAESQDAESLFNQQRISEIAAINEARIVNYFRRMGLNFKSESELIEEQIKLHGRPILTPDILFIDEVYINNQRVYWLDYKDYVGTTVGFLYNSNKAQADKYNASLGPGAICYHGGFVENTVIANTLLLGTNELKIKLE
jgi:hypothetical protein